MNKRLTNVALITLEVEEWEKVGKASEHRLGEKPVKSEAKLCPDPFMEMSFQIFKTLQH